MCYFKSAAKILVIPALPPGPPHPRGAPPPPRKKPPAEAHVSRPSSPVKRSTADPTQWSAVESEEIPRPAELPAQRAGSAAVREISELVGEGGFEPPKSVTTDLQSAPFDRSGNFPYFPPQRGGRCSAESDIPRTSGISNPAPSSFRRIAGLFVPGPFLSHRLSEPMEGFEPPTS